MTKTRKKCKMIQKNAKAVKNAAIALAFLVLALVLLQMAVFGSYRIDMTISEPIKMGSVEVPLKGTFRISNA